ncbi:hypothetical protein L596_007702 [Steinernema carpocapsae]|uniref:Phosphoglycerate mutase family protein n=1 Tax=Steinernema carpocapsae TaxID=34508 RepID=A0A4V6A631_STECR|nr:hypothetical protein L596_007702 [Steinernema carpocapsae]
MENEGVLLSKLARFPGSKKDRRRLVLLMRSAEDVKSVFGPSWMNYVQRHGNSLRFSDGNVPRQLSAYKRADLSLDAPITPTGKFTAQLVARAIFNANVVPTGGIFCSPALRCIETADAIAAFLDMQFNVENALYQPFAWVERDYEPSIETCAWLADYHTLKKSPRVNRSYEPLLPFASIDEEESEVESLGRIHAAVQQIADRERNGPVLIIAHAITLQVAENACNEKSIYAQCLSETETSKTESKTNSSVISHINSSEVVTVASHGSIRGAMKSKYPFCHLLAMAKDGYKLRRVETNIPPLTMTPKAEEATAESADESEETGAEVNVG